MELVPGREPKAITYQQYQDYTPERIEMYENNLFFSEDERVNMLLLLLQNIGLETLPQETRKELIEVVEDIEMKRKCL